MLRTKRNLLLLFVSLIVFGISSSASLATERYIVNVVQNDDLKDFERWSLNDAGRYFGQEPWLGYVEYNTDKSHIRIDEGSVKFIMKPIEEHHSYSWIEWQYYISDRYWLSEECALDGSFYIWIKGDGSGTELKIVLRDGTFNVPFISSKKLTLDSTEWELYEFPFSTFKTSENDEPANTSLVDYWNVMQIFCVGIQGNSGHNEVVFYVDGMEADGR